MVFHGLDVTHLDSLAHIFWDGKMYGGAPASLVSDRQGALDARRARRGARRHDARGAARHRPAARRRRAGRRRPRLPRGPRGRRGRRRHPRRARRRGADAHRRGRRPPSRRAATTTPTSPAPGSRPRACRGCTSAAWRCSPPTSPRTRRRRATAPCTCRSTWSASSPWACGSSTTASSRTSPTTCDRLGRWEFQFALAPDPLPGRDRQPGEPARRVLTPDRDDADRHAAAGRRPRARPRSSSPRSPPAAGWPCLLVGHEAIGGDGAGRARRRAPSPRSNAHGCSTSCARTSTRLDPPTIAPRCVRGGGQAPLRRRPERHRLRPDGAWSSASPAGDGVRGVLTDGTSRWELARRRVRRRRPSCPPTLSGAITAGAAAAVGAVEAERSATPQ